MRYFGYTFFPASHLVTLRAGFSSQISLPLTLMED